MKFKNLLLTALFAFVAMTAFAQAPQKFNYQAVARDLSGVVLANQAVGLEISIREGSSTGTIVYTETHTATTTNIGLINVAIGGGTVTSGTFANIGWGTGVFFVEIGMDASGDRKSVV